MSEALVRVWVSLGSNIEPRAHIRQALDDLRDEFGELVISPIYESEAMGCEGDNFLNLVVGFRTNLPPDILAERLRQVEQSNGRLREVDKFAPRTMDIDLLTYGDLVVDEPGIRLPRNEITRYAFVLLPLSEVAGEELHPLLGCSYRELWNDFDDPTQQLWRVAEES